MNIFEDVGPLTEIFIFLISPLLVVVGIFFYIFNYMYDLIRGV